MSAITYHAIQTIAEAGDNIISASTPTAAPTTCSPTPCPARHPGALCRLPRPGPFAPLIDARTKAIYCESVGNPLGNITDFEALAAIAHAHGVPLIRWTTPCLALPVPADRHGADIVVHSLTKYLGGHGTTLGGIIVDSGKFPWAEHKARFRGSTSPTCPTTAWWHRGPRPGGLHRRAPGGAAAGHGRGDQPVQRLS